MDTLTLSNDTVVDLRDRLDKLRVQKVDDIYDQAIERIQHIPSEYDRGLALDTLGLITLAQRPLQIVELKHALACRADISILGSRNLQADFNIPLEHCGGLLKFLGDIVTPAHYTTAMYLKDRSQELFPGLQAQIAAICIRYLGLFSMELPDSHQIHVAIVRANESSSFYQGTQYELVEWKDLDQKFPFVTYTAMFLGFHLKQSEEKEDTQKPLVDMLATLLKVDCKKNFLYMMLSNLTLYPKRLPIWEISETVSAEIVGTNESERDPVDNTSDSNEVFTEETDGENDSTTSFTHNDEGPNDEDNTELFATLEEYLEYLDKYDEDFNYLLYSGAVLQDPELMIKYRNLNRFLGERCVSMLFDDKDLLNLGVSETFCATLLMLGYPRDERKIHQDKHGSVLPPESLGSDSTNTNLGTLWRHDQIEEGVGNPKNQTQTVDIQKDALVTTLGSPPVSVIHIAACLGWVPLLLHLAQFTMSLDLLDQEGLTPLTLATACGNIAVVEALLKLGARIDASSREGQALLLHLCQSDPHGMMHSILAPIAVPTEHHVIHALQIFFAVAVWLCYTVVLYHRDGVAPVKMPREPCKSIPQLQFLRAASSGDLLLMQALIDAGWIDVTIMQGLTTTALFLAVASEHLEMVRYLLGHGTGINVNARGIRGMTPLHLAGLHANVEMVKFLLREGADVTLNDDAGQTAFSQKTENDHPGRTAGK